MKVLDEAAVRSALNWNRVVAALRDGHRGSAPSLKDMLLEDGDKRTLIRASWAGTSLGLKAVTIFPANPDRNPPLPAIQGQVMLFDGDSGDVVAIVDGTELTYWKTAGDSALGADQLARSDCRTLCMVGAGAMAEPLIRAHLSVRPGIERVLLWNRSADRVEALADKLTDLKQDMSIAPSLENAVRASDLISVATMATQPVVMGEWLQPGTHLDLVGAYRPDMREADDEVFRRGRLFVDCRDTTIGEIGELMVPMAAGVFGEDAVLGDHWDMVAGRAGRQSDDEITVFKNGGGAHLDVMVARLAAGL